MDIKAIDKQYVANTYGRFPLHLVSGKGSLVYDNEGKEYIDMGTGIAVNVLGIADEEWQAAVTAQLAKLPHTSNLYYTEPCALLAKELCERTGMKKVFFGNSGAEANECAIKVARKYSEDKYGPGRHTIITLNNSFHGRTLTTLAATGQEHFHELFQPLTPGFVSVEAESEAIIEAVNKGGVCAIMFEVVRGEGGVLPLDEELMKTFAKLAKEHDLLLLADEVQTGNGRTGELYAYMHYGITPDVVTTAKGIGGGLPLGLAMMGEKVENVLGPGDHGSTFGGNPVSCAGALSILSRIDAELLAGVKAKHDYIVSEFDGAKGVQSVSGLGLMLGIKTDKSAADVVKGCMDKGVLVLTAKDKVRLLPALNIPMAQLEKAVAVLKEVCAQ